MEQNNIFSTNRRSLNPVQENLNININLTDSLIGKILCFKSSAKLDQINSLQGEAIVSGTVFSNLIYLNEVGELKTKNTQTPFNLRVIDAQISPLNQILGKVEIIESAITLATENEVEANTTLEVVLTEFYNSEIKQYVPMQDSIMVKTEKCMLNTVRANGLANFNVVGEQNIKLNTNEVFISGVNACTKSVIGGTGYFTVEGEVVVNLIAQSQDEDKPIKCFTQTLSFKEEIENETLLKDDLILAYITPKTGEATLEQTGEDGKNQIAITVPMQVDYIALFSEERATIKDAFSISCETTLEKTDVLCTSFNPTKYLEARVDGNFTILDTEPRIAKIVCVSPNNLSLTKTFVNDNLLVVEGLITACVSYETDDDETLLNSVQTEIPFSVSFKNVVEEADNVFVIGSVCSANARAKKGKEIDLDLDLCFGVDTYKSYTESVVSNVIFGECQTKSDYALRVYVAPKNSTLWDLSKKLKTTEEQIIKQNPNVVFPLQETTNIIYFSGKQM